MYEMVYVIKRDEDKNILISSFLPLPISKKDEDESDIKLLYTFDWDYNATLPCIRWFALRPWIEKEDIYIPEVLDYLETIKDMTEPPHEELRRVYGVKDKIETIKGTIKTLEEIGIIDAQKDVEIPTNLVYEDDLYSQLYRSYPDKVIDIAQEWLSFSQKDRDVVIEIHRTKNIEKQLELADVNNIPPEFLPLSLRIPQSKKEILCPEYRRDDAIFSDKEKREEVLSSVLCKIKAGDILSFNDIRDIFEPYEKEFGTSIRLKDLSKYFEIRRIPRKSQYKIIKRL